MKRDPVKDAKAFAATYLPMLTDKQHERVVIALAKLLEQTAKEARTP